MILVNSKKFIPRWCEMEHTAMEDLDHWCAYNNIDNDNKEELLRIIDQYVNEKYVVEFKKI
jgi:hypothetical protein